MRPTSRSDHDSFEGDRSRQNHILVRDRKNWIDDVVGRINATVAVAISGKCRHMFIVGDKTNCVLLDVAFHFRACLFKSPC